MHFKTLLTSIKKESNIRLKLSSVLSTCALHCSAAARAWQMLLALAHRAMCLGSQSADEEAFASSAVYWETQAGQALWQWALGQCTQSLP